MVGWNASIFILALTAHVDFFPTIVDLCGADISRVPKGQVEGRSLLPLMKAPQAKWADRYLFTHFGRWDKKAGPQSAKYRMTAVRNKNWVLVSANATTKPKWELFDQTKDYAQKTDVANSHPEIVKELSDQFEKWWQDCVPLMVNESSNTPVHNSFAERYWKQFGGGPKNRKRK